jgi:hypothetical protein
MPTLLCPYLGSAAFRRELMERLGPTLRQREIRMVLADDWIAPSDRELFDDTLELPPSEDVVEAVRALQAYSRAHPIDGVLAQTEAALPSASVLIERLGLHGVGVDAALRCASKDLSRRALSQASVPVPRFRLVESARDVREFQREIGGPVVLKAVASAMARLVAKLEDPREAEAAVQRLREGLTHSTDVARLESFARAASRELGCDPRRQFLVEELLLGDPVETDGLIDGTAIHTFGVTDQIMPLPPRCYIEGYLLPSDRSPESCARIGAVSDAALRASGLARSDASAGFSIELRARGDDVRVIEVNGRLGEDDGFARLFQLPSRREPHPSRREAPSRREPHSPWWCAIELALGGELGLGATRGVRRAVAYRSCYEDGVVAQLPSEEELGALRAQGLEAGLSVKLGERMHAPGHPEAFPHLAWVLATHPTSSRAAYARAREAVENLRFEITSRLAQGARR